MANKPQALIKLAGPNRKVSFISEDGETINAIKEGINTYKLSGSDAHAPIIESVYTYKGSKATYDELPTENNKVGDVWNVVAEHDTTPAGTNYAWTGTAWDALGGTYVDTNTWRPIQVGGTEQLADASTAINFTGSGGTSVSYENGTITVATPEVGSGANQVAAGNHTHSGYAATSHNHTKSQITDFPSLATVATSGSYNDLSNKPTIPAAYTLPTAAANVLGGVKVGSGLSITDGVLSATGGGGSDNAGTKVVTENNKTSLQAVTNLSPDYAGNSRGNGAVDLQQYRTGNTQVASGSYSVAMGCWNEASGSYSVAMGCRHLASGDSSVAMGYSNTASGYFSVAMGDYNYSYSSHSITMGSSNYNYGSRALLVGNRGYNKVDDTICNNVMAEYGIPQICGSCGFKGITCKGTSMRLWDLSKSPIFIARINIIDASHLQHQVQNIIVYDGEFIRNDTEYPSASPKFSFQISYSNYTHYLDLVVNSDTPTIAQIGIFYTISQQHDYSDSSDSSSTSDSSGGSDKSDSYSTSDSSSGSDKSDSYSTSNSSSM